MLQLLMKQITLDKFTELLSKANLSKKDFSDISQIPHGTVLNWGTKRGDKDRLKIPLWVEPFLNLYIQVNGEVEKPKGENH